MPTLPFFEQQQNGDTHRQVADASDFTRFKRMAATAAPFLTSSPKLGWKSPSLYTDVQFITRSFGAFRGKFPNSS